jgi:hypothetical protein
VLRQVARLFAVFLLACSGDDSKATNPDSGTGNICKLPPYSVPAGTDLTKPVVSLKNDVVPIFKGSCGLSSSCHQSSGNAITNHGVFLGNDPAKVFQATANVKSVELATMSFVTPNDPPNSYLMHKMDGDQCQFDAQCDGGSFGVTGCGDLMPQGQLDPLDEPTRLTVRRWIAQGAQNN